jgi:surface protein
MQKCFTSFLFFLFISVVAPASQFITRWDLTYPGTSADSISFGVSTIGIVNYTWETIPAGTSGSGTFTGTTATIGGLPANATIRLKIDSANFTQFNMGVSLDQNRLFDVEQWGSVVWSSMNNAFVGCEYLNITAIDIPNVFNVSSFNNCFHFCTALTGLSNINSWDVSNATDMEAMFAGATGFNQPIGNWNVSNVTNMQYMFFVASSFNQPIGNWDVSNVTDMSSMFGSAFSFNQPIGNWNVSNVVDMNAMFSNANSFNQPVLITGM